MVLGFVIGSSVTLLSEQNFLYRYSAVEVVSKVMRTYNISKDAGDSAQVSYIRHVTPTETFTECIRDSARDTGKRNPIALFHPCQKIVFYMSLALCILFITTMCMYAYNMHSAISMGSVNIIQYYGVLAFGLVVPCAIIIIATTMIEVYATACLINALTATPSLSDTTCQVTQKGAKLQAAGTQNEKCARQQVVFQTSAAQHYGPQFFTSDATDTAYHKSSNPTGKSQKVFLGPENSAQTQSDGIAQISTEIA